MACEISTVRTLALRPCRVGLVVSVSASHTVGRVVQTASLHGTQCVSLAVQPDCLKGRVVCRTVDGDIQDLLGSFARVGYCIPVPDFYLVVHGLRSRKSTIID